MDTFPEGGRGPTASAHVISFKFPMVMGLHPNERVLTQDGLTFTEGEGDLHPSLQATRKNKGFIGWFLEGIFCWKHEQGYEFALCRGRIGKQRKRLNLEIARP